MKIQSEIHTSQEGIVERHVDAETIQQDELVRYTD